MSSHAVVSNHLLTHAPTPAQDMSLRATPPNAARVEPLAASITQAASKQTYYTIRLLVDRGRVANAYRAYAYFRWVDDRLDAQAASQPRSLAFVERQQALVEVAYRGEQPPCLSPEERMLFDLVRSDDAPGSGLQAYIHHLMNVMVFDAQRRGQTISQQALATYSGDLATSVTEALHYFIGHNDPTPVGTVRYLAVTAAHITHMLRDTYEDVAAGYYNIAGEFLAAHGISPTQVHSDAYREWVKARVQLARDYFRQGSDYLCRVKSRRCRIAGFAYMARFESVLATIERDDYRLRPNYDECKRLMTCAKAAWAVLNGAPGFAF
ncbi:MAG: squalene/phytoene synthase family protein [Anaerolineae bacterium]|nr:squalene/phytoene synthase family protein [Anaerolineae bacterium]